MLYNDLFGFFYSGGDTMSATVGAALKKILVALLSDPKVIKTILGIVIGIIIIVVMPIVAVVSIFNGKLI